MKKKNLKNLDLRKYSISNLAILHKKAGEASDPHANSPTLTNPPDSITQCTAVHSLLVSECPTLYFTNCNTGDNTTRVQPPTEYQGCNNASGMG